MSADAHEVMHRAESADCGPFLNDYVPTKRRRIGEDDVIANDTIVRDVRIRHDQRVAAHAG